MSLADEINAFREKQFGQLKREADIVHYVTDYFRRVDEVRESGIAELAQMLNEETERLREHPFENQRISDSAPWPVEPPNNLASYDPNFFQSAPHGPGYYAPPPPPHPDPPHGPQQKGQPRPPMPGPDSWPNVVTNYRK
jgi:hypothetical protein